jgi:hypothetical protein
LEYDREDLIIDDWAFFDMLMQENECGMPLQSIPRDMGDRPSLPWYPNPRTELKGNYRPAGLHNVPDYMKKDYFIVPILKTELETLSFWYEYFYWSRERFQSNTSNRSREKLAAQIVAEFIEARQDSLEKVWQCIGRYADRYEELGLLESICKKLLSVESYRSDHLEDESLSQLGSLVPSNTVYVQVLSEDP